MVQEWNITFHRDDEGLIPDSCEIRSHAKTAERSKALWPHSERAGGPILLSSNDVGVRVGPSDTREVVAYVVSPSDRSHLSF